MLRIIRTVQPALLLACLICTAIYLPASTEGLDSWSSLEGYPDELASAIVSRRSPNVIVAPPLNFAWLPEAINAYYLASLGEGAKNFPAQETVQEAITEHLTASGYLYNGSIYSGRDILTRKKSKINTPPKDLVAVKSWTWATDFGAIGLLRDITLENKGNQEVKDLRIKVGYLGTTSEKEGYWGPTSIFVIHDSLPANSEKTFRDINIGFRHPDERKQIMSVLSVKTVIHDLLIGYFLVPENTINQTELNRTYNITAVPSENNADNAHPNEYKKGTLIIDVIDAQTYRLVWRGAVQTLTDADSSPDKSNEMIDLAVGRLIKSFIESNK